MQTRNYIQSSLSMFGGLFLGAGLMYVFDPVLGSRRREYLGEVAKDYYSRTGETAESLGARSGLIGRLSRRLAKTTGETAQSISERAGDVYGQFRGSSTRKAARRFGRRLSDKAHDVREQAMALAGRYIGRPRRSSSPLTVSLTAVGALCLGAGLMYIFDPQQGRRRRAVTRDRAMRAGHDATDAVRKTSRYVSDHARGFVAETKARFTEGSISDEQLRERVRAQMGRGVSNPGAIDVYCESGVVVLSGPIHASEVDSLMAIVGSVRGVKDVENRLDVRQDAGNIPGLQGTQPQI
jgi:hypothetical protein